MLSNAPREEVVGTFRGLAELIQDALPRRVTADDIFLPWETTAATLLARIARQGQTLALLVEEGHELDAEMVMRSQLEHEILFAWLAITPQDTSRKWEARNPEQNTLWWMVDQYRREKRANERQDAALGSVIDAQMRAALRAMKQRLKALPDRGEFPGVLTQAQDVDAHWAPRLEGFYVAEPRTPGFVMTYTGHYWTLYMRGSSSVHPDYGAIRRFLRPPTASGYQRHYIRTERTGDTVVVTVSIAAYLMGEAVAVADAVLGWNAFDDVLRLLGRWDEVRAPNLLIAGIREQLDRQPQRIYGRSGKSVLSIEISREDQLIIVVVDPDGMWNRLSVKLGTNQWTLRNDTGDEVSPGAVDGKFPLGPVVMERVALLADTQWLGNSRPADWPEEAP